MKFHHNCWQAYKSLSGIEKGPVGIGDDWPPHRIELLRMNAGLTEAQFYGKLKIAHDKYKGIMEGNVSLTYEILKEIKSLAVLSKFEQDKEIDWSDRRAFFSLRKFLGWSCRKLAAELGCSNQQMRIWDRKGIPKKSVRTRARLSRLAKKHGFDAGNVVDDRIWDHAYLQKIFKESGKTELEWSMAGKCSQASFSGWKSGRRRIYRDPAWHLTRAASMFGMELPSKGDVMPSEWLKRKDFPPELQNLKIELARRRIRKKRRVWSIEEMMMLGTIPDRILGELIGKTRMAVMLMRRNIGDIPAIDPRFWDGVIVAQNMPEEEMRRRWEAFKNRAKARTMSQRVEYNSANGASNGQ